MTPEDSSRKTLVQCDFDGTITEEDVSFVILDLFAHGDWRGLLEQYKSGGISVGQFNTRAFAMVDASRAELLQAIRGKVAVRPGLSRMLALCAEMDLRFVIVSNGLDFYIEHTLAELGLDGVEMHAASTAFRPGGLDVRYLGPDGATVQDGFKEAYVRSFLARGYRVVYIGNGDSDIPPAMLARHVFATGDLLTHFREKGLPCRAFADLNEVADAIRLL